jgi:hypothetical protein
MKRITLLMGLLVGILLSSVGCGLLVANLSPDGVDPNIERYTAYNIWYEKPASVWSTNYKTGMVIPAGTKVTNVRVGYKRGHSLIAFNVPSMNNGEFRIAFTKRHHGSLTFKQFTKRVFTTKTFKELSKGLTKEELKAIQSPRPYICKGMTKKAVILSWGYPPEVATPATSLNAWKYWIHRFKTIVIRFDKNGKTTKASDVI